MIIPPSVPPALCTLPHPRFAGYFECQLYKDVTLNTHPPTITPNMFSWFPIFFPLREPVYVPAGAAVEAQMWRCCSPHKVGGPGGWREGAGGGGSGGADVAMLLPAQGGAEVQGAGEMATSPRCAAGP